MKFGVVYSALPQSSINIITLNLFSKSFVTYVSMYEVIFTRLCQYWILIIIGLPIFSNWCRAMVFCHLGRQLLIRMICFVSKWSCWKSYWFFWVHLDIVLKFSVLVVFYGQINVAFSIHRIVISHKFLSPKWLLDTKCLLILLMQKLFGTLVCLAKSSTST